MEPIKLAICKLITEKDTIDNRYDLFMHNKYLKAIYPKFDSKKIIFNEDINVFQVGTQGGSYYIHNILVRTNEDICDVADILYKSADF